MADKNNTKSFIKSKSNTNAPVGFKVSNFSRTNAFKPGGMKPGVQGFNPSVFKTQHKG